MVQNPLFSIAIQLTISVDLCIEKVLVATGSPVKHKLTVHVQVLAHAVFEIRARHRTFTGQSSHLSSLLGFGWICNVWPNCSANNITCCTLGCKDEPHACSTVPQIGTHIFAKQGQVPGG